MDRKKPVCGASVLQKYIKKTVCGASVLLVERKIRLRFPPQPTPSPPVTESLVKLWHLADRRERLVTERRIGDGTDGSVRRTILVIWGVEVSTPSRRGVYGGARSEGGPGDGESKSCPVSQSTLC